MEGRAYRTILVAAHDGIATVTLNKPERKNPLGPEMVNELCYAITDAKNDPGVRVVVMTGAGKAFSAGGDLKQMSEGGDALPPLGTYPDLLLLLDGLGKPSIARIPGVAMGGGLGLVAACDFAVAAESATFGTPEIKRGLFPMMIMAVLRRVVSRRKLLELMLLGETIDAAAAERLELVSRVVPDGELDAAVNELATRLAAQSPTAMRLGLAAWNAQADLGLAQALPMLEKRLFEILGTEDAREGLMAFVEKGKPVWTGR